MRRSFRLAIFSVNVLAWVLFGVAQNAPAQASASAETPQARAVLTKLSPPVYPPLARQANIFGEVKVDVAIRRDGSVASVALFSGHPMLAPAAMESAKRSDFECRGCDESTTSYLLSYTFELKDDGDCCNAYSRAAVVTESQGRVTISAPNGCLCDPGAEIQKVRSAKCFYLWKCGRR